MRWITSQIGSREHYAVPRAFHRYSTLSHCYTDFWVGPAAKKFLKSLPGPGPALAQRSHPELPASLVTSFNLPTLRFELSGRFGHADRSRPRLYERFDAIGSDFAKRVAHHLERHPALLDDARAFLYSTGALETAEFLKSRNVPIIVNQLDPARLDEEMVTQENQRWPGWEAMEEQIPETYYQRLKNEWSLADLVLVNSNWSRQNLLNEGIDPGKIIVVPLVYELESAPTPRGQERQDEHDAPHRTLRVLWLGQIVLRKGIPYLFEAAKKLQSTDIRFDVAGRVGISPHAIAQAPANVNVLGRVPRSQALELYQQADVFVLPTVSDGFAITQLEAMAHGLPVITTTHCGEVVTDGVDGFIVDCRDADALAAAIEKLDRDRDLLRSMSQAAVVKAKDKRFSLEAFVLNVEAQCANDRRTANEKKIADRPNTL